MDLLSILRGVSGRVLIDSVGQRDVACLQPPASPARIAEIERAIGFALPRELRDLIAVSAGIDFEASDSLDFADIDACPIEGLFAHVLTIVGDGAGNFWVIELRADSTVLGPVWFLCHDAPVLVYQAATLAEFLVEYLAYLEDLDSGPIAHVLNEAVSKVWSQRDDVPRDELVGASDAVLRAFALRLEPGWFVRDLRGGQVGDGISIGRFGPRTPLARAGSEFVFAYGTRTRMGRMRTFFTGR